MVQINAKVESKHYVSYSAFFHSIQKTHVQQEAVTDLSKCLCKLGFTSLSLFWCPFLKERSHETLLFKTRSLKNKPSIFLFHCMHITANHILEYGLQLHIPIMDYKITSVTSVAKMNDCLFSIIKQKDVSAYFRSQHNVSPLL